MKYSKITTIRSAGSPYSACFDHVERAFSAASNEPIVAFDTENTTEDAIIIGAHAIPEGKPLIRDCAIWNTEQIFEGSGWVTPHYLRLCRDNELWDYSAQNVEAWKELHGIEAKWVPLGWHESMVEAWEPLPGGDVVMFGSINDRRREILKDSGVKMIFGEWGSDLQRRLAKTGAVVNVHYYDSSVFEIVRCSQLWANGMPVISEKSPGDPMWEQIMPDGTFLEREELAAAAKARAFPSGEDQKEAYRNIKLKQILISARS